jgi:hypothetical protein
MSKIKTVTYEGKVYQIGGIYEFSDNGDSWETDKLVSISYVAAYPFKVAGCEWSLIRETESKIGTITPAPIELIDNGAYMFDFKDETCIGFYELSQEAFFDRHDGGKQIAKLSFCTNIRPMTVESK